MNLDRRALLAGLGAAALVPSLAAAQDWTPPAPDQELRVPVRGGSIYVRVNGDLKSPHTPVVFAHGGPGSTHSSFLPAVALADQRAVILYDQLDSGLSDHPNDPANWTVERFVSEVDAIRAALALSHLHFVGHSWGSTIALEYAARQPAGLDSLTLGSPLISTRSWQKSTLADLARLPPDVIHTIKTNEAAGTTDSAAYQRAMDVFYDHYMTRAEPPAYVRAYSQGRHLATNQRLYQTMWGAGEISASGTLKTYNGEPLLPKIKAPTLFLCGEDDEMTAGVLKPMVARVKGARLAVISGAGHGLPSTHSKAYVALLRDHLGRHDPKAA
jgi:proline iminopeptidase/L-proline amide hydrolase